MYHRDHLHILFLFSKYSWILAIQIQQLTRHCQLNYLPSLKSQHFLKLILAFCHPSPSQMAHSWCDFLIFLTALSASQLSLDLHRQREK